MEFDPCNERMRQLAIKAAKLLRPAMGLPEERDLAKLLQWIGPQLGVPPSASSRGINHLPAPWESKNEQGEFYAPRMDCPFCGKKMTMVLLPMCLSCKESEGAKYKCAYTCKEQLGGCGRIGEKFEMSWSQKLKSMGIEPPIGMKKDHGVQTITDEGLK